jgi:hypothetical protein
MDDQARYILLKKINDKLVWIVILLVLIMFNTCSLPSRFSDAMQIGPDAVAKKDQP